MTDVSEDVSETSSGENGGYRAAFIISCRFPAKLTPPLTCNLLDRSQSVTIRTANERSSSIALESVARRVCHMSSGNGKTVTETIAAAAARSLVVRDCSQSEKKNTQTVNERSKFALGKRYKKMPYVKLLPSRRVAPHPFGLLIFSRIKGGRRGDVSWLIRPKTARQYEYRTTTNVQVDSTPHGQSNRSRRRLMSFLDPPRHP